MTNDEKIQLKEILDKIYENFGRPMNAAQASTWLEILEPYSFADIQRAFAEYKHTMTRPPFPGDITPRLPDPLGHPSAEEAWAHVPKNDFEGGFVTQQMLNALQTAEFSLDSGDVKGAKFAFFETYKAEVMKARLHKIKAEFFYSAAFGVSREQFLMEQEAHILNAAKKQWITTQRAMKLLNVICAEQGKELTPFLIQLGIAPASLPPTIATSPNASHGIERVTQASRSIVQDARCPPALPKP